MENKKFKRKLFYCTCGLDNCPNCSKIEFEPIYTTDSLSETLALFYDLSLPILQHVLAYKVQNKIQNMTEQDRVKCVL